MLVLIPPTILHQMQAILYLPVITNQTIQVLVRNGIWIKATDEMASLTRHQFLLRIPCLAVYPHHNLAIRNIQRFTKIFCGVDVAPEFSGNNVPFFFDLLTASGFFVGAS